MRLVAGIFAVNLILLTSLVITVGGADMPDSASMMTTVARVAALTGTYLMLVQLILVARVRWLDAVFGIDRLARWHMKNGRLAFTLVVLHVVLVVTGRARANHMGDSAMMASIMHYPYMVPAVIGFGLIVACVVTSIGRARRRLHRHRWHSIHLWSYIGVLASFAHELKGLDFQSQPIAQSYLWSLYIATFGLVLYFRLYLPIRCTFVHQLRVTEVVEESKHVTSIYLEGNKLDDLRVEPGQFFYWRFLTKHDWREVHPYSVSCAPNSEYLRITVKQLGDASRRARDLDVGTWVAFEGPFGVFAPKKRQSHKSVLIAAGVGITPIRSLLEGMSTAPGDMAVLYRANTHDELVLLDEMEQLAAQRRVDLHLVLGFRENYPPDGQPLSPNHLNDIVPDIADCDVHVGANAGVSALVMNSLKQPDVPARHVHREEFTP